MSENADIIDPEDVAPNGEIFSSPKVKEEFLAAEEISKELPYNGIIWESD